MMYVYQETGEKVTAAQIKAMLPGVSFGHQADLSGLGFPFLELVDPPMPNPNEQVVDGEPEEYEPGKWRQTWDVLPTPVPQSVSAIQGMLALEQAGLVQAFLDWKAALDPVQDFAALAYLDKSDVWRYDSPVIDEALAELELMAQKDALFQAAAAISV